MCTAFTMLPQHNEILYDNVPCTLPAFGCVASMLFELIYHIWPPEYRHGSEIEDPLHVASSIPDSKSADGGGGTEELKKTIKKHQDEHEVGKGFKWRFSTHKTLHGAACNGVLAGLVGITAGCATMNHFHAMAVSVMSALLYHAFYRIFISFKIDDAVNAGAVHFVCGGWGLFAAGFTATSKSRFEEAYPGREYCSAGDYTRTSVCMLLIIIAYAFVCTLLIWIALFITCQVEVTRQGAEFPSVIQDRSQRVFQNNMVAKFTTYKQRLAELEALKQRVEQLESGNDRSGEQKLAESH